MLCYVIMLIHTVSVPVLNIKNTKK